MSTSSSSVQKIKRKQRLSAKDLSILAKKKCWGACVDYNFGHKENDGPKVGWYLHNPRKPAYFIGRNWVVARDFITQMPTDSILKKYVPAFLGGAS